VTPTLPMSMPRLPLSWIELRLTRLRAPALLATITPAPTLCAMWFGPSAPIVVCIEVLRTRTP
jgi:hypothetical protein